MFMAEGYAGQLPIFTNIKFGVQQSFCWKMFTLLSTLIYFDASYDNFHSNSITFSVWCINPINDFHWFGRYKHDILFLVYPSGVSLGTNSMKFLKSLPATSNLWKRQKDSCQPLKIKLGSFKIFGRAMVLTTLHLVLVWTARYILIFSKLNRI